MDVVLDIFLHLDVHLNEVISQLGPWAYLLLFAIIFCETGLVVTPFLPGDSLLFALGTLAATEDSVLKLPYLAILLVGAAIMGDAVNYAIGFRIGPKIFQEDPTQKRKWLNRKHLLATEAFYKRHGGKTILLARFLPIIRTFAPFVAGVGRMGYLRFASFNCVGGLLWVISFLFTGYFFGAIPIVKEKFEFAVLGIIVVSCLPLLFRIAASATKTV